jgi:hypothetical protein
MPMVASHCRGDSGATEERSSSTAALEVLRTIKTSNQHNPLTRKRRSGAREFGRVDGDASRVRPSNVALNSHYNLAKLLIAL